MLKNAHEISEKERFSIECGTAGSSKCSIIFAQIIQRTIRLRKAFSK